MQEAYAHSKHIAAVATALAATFASCVAAWQYGLSPATLEFGVAIVALAVATLRDCESRIIPNACIVALFGARGAFLAIGLATGFATPDDIASSLSGAAAIGGGLTAMALATDRLMKAESIGGGDVKLFAAAGAYFGIEGGGAVVLVACLLGLITSRLFGDGDGKFAFGPAIALSFCFVMAFP